MIWIERIAYMLALFAAITYWQMPDYMPYVLGAAGILLGIVRFQEKSDNFLPADADKHLKFRTLRLFRIRRFVCACWLVGAYLMLRPGNYWILALLISVVLDLYSMFVIERIIKKSNLQK